MNDRDAQPLKPESVAIAGAFLITLFCVVSVGQSVSLAHGSDGPSGVAHGTINVLLGNSHGLVVVTDSRLSDEHGRPFARGAQKLFRLDDRTVCSIAGWYSDRGPAIRADIAGAPSYPIELAVPDIMQNITAGLGRGGRDIEQELDVVSGLFGSVLSEVAFVDQQLGQRPSSSPFQITIAGYEEDGKLKIATEDLIPEVQDGRLIQYNHSNRSVVDVPGPAGFVARFRGITSAADAIMNLTDPSISEDPVLSYFRSVKTGGRLNSLDVTDLKQIAGAIEWRTSEQFVGVVGGLLQTAVLSGGRVSEFDEPVRTTYQIPRSVFFEWNGSGTIVDQGHNTPTAIGLRLRVPAIVFMRGPTFSNVIQPLDNLILFGATFTHCHLVYLGSPRSVFDRSNTIVDSDLILLPGADPNSNFVQQIKRDFPTLHIVDHTGSNMTASGAVIDVE